MSYILAYDLGTGGLKASLFGNRTRTIGGGFWLKVLENFWKKDSELPISLAFPFPGTVSELSPSARTVCCQIAFPSGLTAAQMLKRGSSSELSVKKPGI